VSSPSRGLALALGSDGGQGGLAGIAVAVYVLPGALGALVLGRWMRRLSAQRLLVTDYPLRAVLPGAVPLAYVAGALTPVRYVGLPGASSLLHAWGKAGKHALFAPLLPDGQRLAANSAISTGLWTATIAGPALAGLLTGAGVPGMDHRLGRRHVRRARPPDGPHHPHRQRWPGAHGTG
jgi:MFS family permease